MFLPRHFLIPSSLALALAARDIRARYRASVLGLLWMVLTPLMMLAVYAFVFAVVFKARFGQETGTGYVLYLYAGLAMHAFLAEILARAPGLIPAHATLATKLVFPLETLSWMAALSAFSQFLISLALIGAAQVCLGEGQMGWAALWVPAIVLPLIPLGLGIGWFLSALGVYLRDIGHLTGLLASLLLFLGPVFYPPEALPPALRPYLALNPLTVPVTQLRAALLEGRAPEFGALAFYWAAALLCALLGYIWFTRLRRGFADAL